MFVLPQDYVEKMREALATEKNPQDANLQAVLPGAHERLNATALSCEQNRIATTDLNTKVDQRLTGLTDAIIEGFQGVAEAMEALLGAPSKSKPP